MPDQSHESLTPEAHLPAVEYESMIARSGDVNVVKTVTGVYRYVSLGSERLFGWLPGELEGRQEVEFAHPDDVASIEATRDAMSEPELATTTYRFRCQDASYRWIETTSRLVRQKEKLLIVSSMRDITARHKHEAVLQHQARTDPLTGVSNRVVLMDRLNQGLLRIKRDGQGLAVVYLDLDRFKVINDSLGHLIGDRLLTDMATRLVHFLRPADTLARLGGDEFVIVAEGVPDEQSAVELADRIIEAGHQAFSVEGEDLQCTLSAGVAWTCDADHEADELLREADLALYRAKDRGRDRAEAFDEDLRATAAGRLVTERMLYRAMQEGRVVVEYQPIVDLLTWRIVGAEALVRIRDPDVGMLYPASFLEVAEETGLLAQIDELVLVDAVEQAVHWSTRLEGKGFSQVAINITPRHLADARFAQSVVDRLDRAGILHDDLQMELTERTLIRASNSSMTSLRSMHDASLQVGLDDFGIGYSSLAYLRQFPLDFVKIDGSFIQGLDGDAGERAIVGAVIGLAHALDLFVTAEGVETRGQLDVLLELGCDRAQGFLFAPSLSPDRLSDLVTKGLSVDQAVARA